MYYEQPTQPVHYVYERRRGRRGCGCLSRLFLGSLLLLALLVFTGTVVASTLIYADLSAEIEEGIATLDTAGSRETFETTRITDRNGELLWEIFGEGKRTKVPLDQIPQALIDATIATEDDTFNENIGLDAPSLLAALIANLRHPDDRPVGGSTITQQIVRHIVFDYDERAEVSYNRKTKEIILAWMMNKKYTKDQILEMYLNEIYYGNLAYGVEAAAQTYFGKSATDLTLAEASLLAALPQSPVELDPLTNWEGAKQRQWLVLNLMVSEGNITRAEAEAAYLELLTFAPQEVSLEAPHFAVYVRQLLEEQFGAEVVANGGLQVTTTLDMNYQRLAELLARQHVTAVGPEHNLTNASLVALKPGTGEILAMLGSLDYHDDTIDGRVNIALTGQQPGSSIKPVTYAAALSPGADGSPPAWKAADILWDVPADYPQFDGSTYEPVNYDGRFHGPLRLRDALANSYNVPAVLVLQDIGVPRLIEFASRMGITTWQNDPSRYGLSLTLGGGEVTPLELTAAYAVLANGGYRIPPVAILRVEKSSGEVLYEYQPPTPELVVDPRVAFLISDILDDDDARVPAMGRTNPLAVPFPAAVKTGTTNDYRDNWTLGYTPGLVVGVWTGNTDNSEMIDISGLTGAAPLWSGYIQAVYGNYDLLATLATNGAQPPAEFVPPPGLEQHNICSLASVTVGATECSLSDSEWFLDERLAGDTPAPDSEAVAWERIDPAVWRIPAVALPPLPEEVLASLGDDDLPPSPYCHFVQGTALAALPPDALPLVFLAPPRNPESREAAYEWAADNNLPILPQTACTEELLAQAQDPNAPAVWRILSPKAGDTISGMVPIVGTADFNPERVQFYKVEIGVGHNPSEWITLGEIHNTPVVNGQLETLLAAAFPPGEYALRLVVVLWDGNYVGEPYVIPVVIE
ncbi:MAG: transglycosylase domain-containing protein [Chloroflexi bacterium]|nr:transglycosylase domain-containing protein [Chloroflexota bacterium]MCI0575132.1 transglycosylase domain-containing protein [Chloroflexota bacterium]MCI0646281.1 transglycosylase domain-containing protein [Chloroflexota bacterium]MCI0728626.1 transglycosylase domain-containing protein [Chloroflexota bacterium]